MSVIGTVRAGHSPATSPSASAAISVGDTRTPGTNSVATTAIAMPAAAVRLPERAVRGELRPLSPRMNITDAAR